MVPLEIIGNENSLTAIRCKKTHPGKLDNSGEAHRLLSRIPGS